MLKTPEDGGFEGGPVVGCPDDPAPAQAVDGDERTRGADDLGRVGLARRWRKPGGQTREIRRRIHLSPSTAHPDSARTSQQARNLALDLDDRSSPIRFLIHDRDTKFSRVFDAVIRSEGARVVLTPIRAPNANAYPERVIETIRAECLGRSSPA